MGKGKAFATFSLAIAPILLTLVLVVLFRVNPLAAMGGVTAALYALHRYSPARIAVSLRESVSARALLLVSASWSSRKPCGLPARSTAFPVFSPYSGLPPMVVLFVLPFLAGLMTGLTIAYVGITFPILMPLMGSGSPSLGLLALAFGSGFAGVMLSPVHLCLVLSREYFNADMTQVYRRLWLPSALVLAAVAVPLYLSR